VTLTIQNVVYHVETEAELLALLSALAMLATLKDEAA
jgi:hypothetical protein